MHTKTLINKPYQFGIPYYRTSEYAPWLCIRYLRNHVELPDPCPKVRLVSTPHEPTAHENYWDIKQDGRLMGVRTGLTNHFQRWNQINYENGDRYVYLEIVE